MPAIVTFDPDNLLILEIDTGGDNSLDGIEIYSEWKDWQLGAAQRMGYPPAFRIVSDSDISPGVTSVPYWFLLSGWKIRPAEGHHKLTITGNVFVDGGIGSIFVPTVGAFTVHTETQVSPQGLIVTQNVGGLQPTQQQIRDAMTLDRTLTPSAVSIDRTISDSKTEVRINVAVVEATSQIRITAHMVRGGVIVTSPLSASLTWRDTDSTTLFSLTETDAEAGQDPDAQGNYVWLHTQALADDVTYSVDVTITDATGPRSDRADVATMKGSN